MALAERRNCKDFVSIFVCEAWKMLQVCLVYKQFEMSYLDYLYLFNRNQHVLVNVEDVVRV